MKNKYKKLYEDMKGIQFSDLLQLVKEADNDEEKKFYTAIMNYFLQTSQKKSIERNVF